MELTVTDLDRFLKTQSLILKMLKDLEKRVQALEQWSMVGPEERPSREMVSFTIKNLIALPDHLRTSMITVIKLGEGSAENVSERTGRVRNLESSYLNQLVRLGYLEKKRKGRKIYFTPKRLANDILLLI